MEQYWLKLITNEDFLVFFKWFFNTIIFWISLIFPLKKMLKIRGSLTIGIIFCSAASFFYDYIVVYVLYDTIHKLKYGIGIDFGLMIATDIPWLLCLWFFFESPFKKNLIGYFLIDTVLFFVTHISKGLSCLTVGRKFSDTVNYFSKADLIYAFFYFIGFWIAMKIFSPAMDRFRESDLKNVRGWILMPVALLMIPLLGFSIYLYNPIKHPVLWNVMWLFLSFALIMSFIYEFAVSFRILQRQRLRMALFNSENTMYQIEMTMHLQKEITKQLEKLKTTSHGDSRKDSQAETCIFSGNTGSEPFCIEKNSVEAHAINLDASYISDRLAVYRDSLNRMYAEMKYVVYCRNWHLNALLNYYYFRFQDMGAQVDIRFQKFNVDDQDLKNRSNSKTVEDVLNYLMNAIMSEWNRSAYAGMEKNLEIQCESVKGMDILTIRCSLKGRRGFSKRKLKSLSGDTLYHLKIEEKNDGMQIEMMLLSVECDKS